MIWQFYIGVFAILGRQTALSVSPSPTCSASKNCSYPSINAASMSLISSPCNPDKYPDNTICRLSLEPANTTFTQVTFTYFDVESWHDYLKFEGPQNFILFANKTTNRVIMTGYPNGTINGEFHSDDDVKLGGYNFTTSSVTARTLLTQYEGYNVTSSAQIMRSPMYVTSADDDDVSNTMDIMAINLGNNTASLARAWPEYVRLVGLTDIVTVYDETSTGFKINWTAIASTQRHVVSIEDNTNKLPTDYNRAATASIGFTATNLPSGSTFTVTVIFINKNDDEASITANGTTLTKAVTKLVVGTVTQKTAKLSWDRIKGATDYQITVNGTSRNEVGGDATITELLPGESYVASITARYASGNSNSTTASFITVPGNVTGLVASASRNFVTVRWDSMKGATSYQLSGNGTSQDVSIPAEQNTKNVTGLTPGTVYAIVVTAVGDGGKSFPSEVTATTDLLMGNEMVNSIASTINSVTVSWTAVEGAKEYVVTTIRISGGQTIASEKVQSDKTEHQISSLVVGTNYTVSVSALSNTGTSHELGSTNAFTVVDSVKNARVMVSTNTSLTITWDNIPGAINYTVAYSDNGHAKIVPSIRDNVLPPFLLGGLTSGRLYNISITAVFEVGRGEAAFTSGWTLPSTVTGLGVTDINTNNFKVTWTSTSDVTYILTLRYTSNNELVWEESDEKTGNSYDTYPGRDYTLIIEAKNPAGLSDAAEVKFQTGLSKPNLKVTGRSQLSFALEWNAVEGASKYEYNCSNTNTRQTVNVQNSKLNVVIKNLTPETRYICTIYAISANKIESSDAEIITTANSVCTSSTCLHDGKCEDIGGNKFVCRCTSSYEGEQCETVKDWCGKGNQGLKCAQDGTTECRNNPIKGQGECHCKENYEGDPTVGCIAYCKKNVLHTGVGVKLHFDTTSIGLTAYSTEVCGTDGGRSQGSVLCKLVGNKPTFDVVIYSSCEANVSNVISSTEVSENVTSDELAAQTAELQLVTSGSDNKVSAKEVEIVSEFIASVSSKAESHTVGVEAEVLSNLANAANNLIQSNSLSVTPTTPTPPVTNSPGGAVPTTTTTAPLTTTISAEEESKKIKRRILKGLNTLASNVKIPVNKSEFVITTPTIVVKVVDAPVSKSFNFSPIVTSASSGNNNESQTVRPVQIQLPRSAVERAKDDKGNVRVSFFLHRDATLFPDPDKSRSPGPIVAATVGNGIPVRNLKEFVELEFDEKKQSGKKNESSRFNRIVNSYECAYWDENSSVWLTDGCFWDLRDVSNPTKCACDHLTNFALLVSKEKLSPNVPLEIVSVIGLVLSMLGLILTIIIHAVKEEVRKRRPTLILFHICVNLLISSIIFIVGIDKIGVRVQCTVIATFMHYFYLTSWTWMTVYAYDMYRSLVQVFGVGKSRYMTKCTLFGYGVPLLITIINVGVTVGYLDPRWKPERAIPNADGIYTGWENLMNRYSAYRAENVCWIHNFSLSIGFLLPVAIMLAFNIFVYAMVIKTLYQRGQTVKSSAKKTSIKDNIFISITLIASTGIAWVFAYLMLLSPDENYLNVMSWIFATLNSVQGLVIFLSTCVRNENMRKIWLQPLTRCCSSTSSKMRLLSPKSDKFEVNPKSTANESLSFSSSTATKGTQVHSISAKPLTSESAI